MKCVLVSIYSFSIIYLQNIPNLLNKVCYPNQYHNSIQWILSQLSYLNTGVLFLQRKFKQEIQSFNRNNTAFIYADLVGTHDLYSLFQALVLFGAAIAASEAYYGYGGYGRGYGGYGGYGYGRGYGYGHYLGKRSADADAEASPALFYGAYGHPFHYGVHPYAYAPLRLAGASSYQHVSTPAATHGIHQLHKREAEADASPDAYYGYAGYGHGYGYGYPHAYGYGRYYGHRAYGYGGYGRYGYGYGR